MSRIKNFVILSIAGICSLLSLVALVVWFKTSDSLTFLIGMSLSCASAALVLLHQRPKTIKGWDSIDTSVNHDL